jgi:hypothetical protein
MKDNLISRILNFIGRCVGSVFLPILESIIENTPVGRIIKGVYEAGQESGIINTPGRLI